MKARLKVRKGKLDGWTAFAAASLVFLLSAAIFGPLFSHYSAAQIGEESLASPSPSHWMGTDIHGRDLLTRLLYGARISFLVGFFGALVSLAIGTVYGALAGYAGGRIDRLLMQLVDLLYSLPTLIFVIVLIALLEAPLRKALIGSHLANLLPYSRIFLLFLGLGLVEWLTMARVVRSRVLVLKEALFVQAARVLGRSPFGILRHHILPHLLGIVAVYLTLTVPAVVLAESFLSFLGLGVEPPSASLGTLLADGAQAINPIKTAWWLLVFPGGMLAWTLWALNSLGDNLRDLLDPSSR
ncbi:Oligopeptide transport system permease protein OppC [Methylacidimicrobium cyclopophantes]|uniref:Oligopeptide transport system permease protein OppC n=1 Tax=Methylacidimicrobium cyclopophantes TaxID=1041766 RepID=A0A5E6MHL3_9BACT|nr:ABC transporter permease [Methylacidimicrobium cyclopophantes]VVM08516.1 Oligopeptide transport system permease protein OppC [Methylacidimicrobium cyclopophantes]